MNLVLETERVSVSKTRHLLINHEITDLALRPL